ncbi:uncharacterized protein LOC111693276 [Trichogramma pretiosum]|uniref:uncharacterized protein LOC111693276 n=1 Tax=Trichogramma pretiosum TaxID=7493 RepID=UPI000C71C2B0|nr:uncharacterized protein LOC111693276 [Trichogramma pretiosum]
MFLTMVDGKVLCALTKTSSQSCWVCEATPSQFKDIDAVLRRPVKEESLKYGFPVLHAKIRFMECVLHVAYRLVFKEPHWRVEQKNQGIMNEHKKYIQDGLFGTLNVKVDHPTPGSGNTNNGNTARKFFENITKVAEVTGKFIHYNKGCKKFNLKNL